VLADKWCENACKSLNKSARKVKSPQWGCASVADGHQRSERSECKESNGTCRGMSIACHIMPVHGHVGKYLWPIVAVAVSAAFAKCGTTHCNMYVCIYIHTQTMDHCSPLRSWTRCRLVSAIYLCNEHKTSETRVSPFAPRHATPPCPLECAPFRGNRTTGLVPQCAHVPMWPCGFYSRFRIHPADDSMVRCECRQVNWQDAHAAYA